jgi:hypothetical protein
MQPQAQSPNDDGKSAPTYLTAVLRPPSKDGSWVAALYKDGKPYGTLQVRSISHLLQRS